MTHVLVNAKAYVALVTAAAAALLTEFGPDGRLGTTLTVIAVLGGVFTTWAVPNADAPHAGPAGVGDEEDGQSTAVTVLVVIALLLLIVFLWRVLVVRA